MTYVIFILIEPKERATCSVFVRPIYDLTCHIIITEYTKIILTDLMTKLEE
jgi:hypothetical protein